MSTLHLHNLQFTSNFITSNTYTFTTSNDIIINMLHSHNLQCATLTNKQIFKYMLYLDFALILVTMLNLCSALKFRTYICVYTKLLSIYVHNTSQLLYVLSICQILKDSVTHFFNLQNRLILIICIYGCDRLQILCFFLTLMLMISNRAQLGFICFFMVFIL